MKVLEDANHQGHQLPRALTYWRLAINYATKATVCTLYAYDSDSSPRKKILYGYRRQALVVVEYKLSEVSRSGVR